MTLAYSQAKIVYQGNGETTRWDIPFAFLDKDHLQITRIESDGKTHAVEGDFEVDLKENALFYPMRASQNPPLPSDCRLMICRHTPLTQQTDFQAQQSFDPFVLEEGYDKAMMIAQEQAEELSRSVKFPAHQSASQTDAAAYLAELQQTLSQAQQANALSSQVLVDAQQAAQTASAAVEGAQNAVEALEGYSASASASAQLAQKWAVQTQSEVQEGQGYGAKKYAIDAQNSAQESQAACQQALSAAEQAQSSAQTASEKAASSAEAQNAAQAAAAAAAQSAQGIDEAEASCTSSAQQAAQSAQQAAATVNGKANADFSNVARLEQGRINAIMPNAMDYIVESFYDQQGNWYEVYKSGKLRQGGFINGNGGEVATSFLKPFANTLYMLNVSCLINDGNAFIHREIAYDKSATGFKSHWGAVGEKVKNWVAEGKGA